MTALDAAGIRDPALRSAYRACRAVNAEHGRSFFLATRLLPASRRPHVHALYAFARLADDIVDAPGDDRAARLAAWQRDLSSGAGHPVLDALRHTIAGHGIDPALLETFLASMRMDLTVTSYPDFGALGEYMAGSAAAIGLAMLPILGVLPGMAGVAAGYAKDLGVAFQLTNFIRDVGEDLRRGRLYLPLADLAAFEVSREQLAAGVLDGRVRRLLAFQIARTREIYRAAQPGIRLLDPTARPCVHAAAALYARILDRVEAADYRVLDRRVSVPLATRLAIAAPALLSARRAGRASSTSST